MTSDNRAPYALGDTRATMVWTDGSKTERSSESEKPYLNSDCSLKPDYMKLESLVIAGQPNCGEYVPGPCTHRPSRHPSWRRPKMVPLTARRQTIEGGASEGGEVGTR